MRQKTKIVPPDQIRAVFAAMLHLRRATVVGFLAFLFFFFMISVSPALAERLESDSFIIQFGNFNMTAGEKSSASYNLTDTVGQTAAGPFGQYGSSDYFIGSGFQYIYQIDTFAFSISDIDIALGTLAPGAHNSDSNTLTITTKGAGGYTVYAFESHPLKRNGSSDTIPDTTCDTSACSETNADPWTNLSIPGFGFNAAGTTVPADFVDTTYYRQFADNSAAEAMQVVMSSVNIGQADTATITYKAGISGNQPAGDYQTLIYYVAVPGF